MNYRPQRTSSAGCAECILFGNPIQTLWREVTTTVPNAINVARSSRGHTAPRPRGGAAFRSGPLESPTRLRAGSLHPGKKKPVGTRELTPHRRRRGGTPPRGPVQERMACIKSAELRGRVPSAESRPHGFCLFDADSALSAVPEPSLGTAFGAGAGAGALGGSAAVGATPAPVQAPSRP
jgi:hypothetical protein